jgi:hypothetical protein
MRRKLILSMLMLALTIITATSTTYAWFAKNRNAWVDDFQLEIENAEGLLISVDGINFSSSISNEELIKAIVAKKQGVKISELNLDTLREDFEAIHLSSVTTKDLESFKTIDQSNVVNGYYQLMEAPKNTYLEFDLYFRIVSNIGQTTSDVQTLSIAHDSVISSEAKSVDLVNSLNAGGTVYNSGDAIAVNPANAIRLGIKVHESDSAIIYEPNLGLGSYAIEGFTEGSENYDVKYDPTKNAMLTYFNKLNESKLAPLSFADNEIYRGAKNFLDDTVISEFKANDEKTKYNDIHITVSLWLEGYDADYFVGVDVKKIKMYLNFEKK